MNHTTPQESATWSDSYMQAVQQLQACHTACARLFTANAPKEAGVNLSYLHLKRLQACMEICEVTARLLLKDGVKAERLCEIAARICEQCADSCEQIQAESMRRCAQACREAARACLAESHRLRTMALGPEQKEYA